METIDQTPASPKTLAGFMHFLLAGLLKGEQTGGIVPSQRFLVGKMIAPVPVSYTGQILELGPGNGALTLRLAARCPKARILACEINPTLAQMTRKNVARAGLSERVQVVLGSAEEVLSERCRNGLPKAEFIISGIPLANLERQDTITLIQAIHGALADRGMYIQFQHSLLDRKKIKAQFRKLRTVPAFLNFPPALVYYAWK
jgi:phospholipid N-methyltransferase